MSDMNKESDEQQTHRHRNARKNSPTAASVALDMIDSVILENAVQLYTVGFGMRRLVGRRREKEGYYQ